MKKLFTNTIFLILCCVSFTSCFVNRFDIGKGSQSSVEVRRQNHYVIGGLVPIKVSNPVKMADGATDYSVTIAHTFLDIVISSVTFGIYAPTTTIVKK